MTFSVKQAIADADLEPYPYEDAQGIARTLPHMKLLSARQLYRVLREGDLVGVLTEVGVDQVEAEAIDGWPGHVIEPFLLDWMKHSDVELPGGEPGKSPSSSPSSKSTPARSKRTSRGGATTSRRRASGS